MRRKLIKFTLCYFILMLAMYAVFTQIFSIIEVSDAQMYPAYAQGNLLLANRLNTDIKRFDTVIYLLSEDTGDKPVLKRVIGLPGETIYIDSENTIYVNGEPIEDTYGSYDDTEGFITGITYTLKDDEYFCMGDNRNHCLDSRSYGAVSKDRIKGTIIFRLWGKQNK